MSLLFKTVAEIKEFTGASMALTLDTLKPHLSYSWAEDEVLKIVGQDLYDSLLAKYVADELDEPGNAHFKSLLPMVQKPLANLAIYSYMQEGGVSIEDQGIIADREKAAFQWQQEKAEAFYIDASYQSLDRLISFLLKNAGDFGNWTDTVYHSIQKDLLVNSPALFNQSVNIRGSYRTFAALLSTLQYVESKYVSPALGAAYLADLKSSLGTSDNQAVLALLRPSICFLAMAEGMMDLNMELTANGVFVQSLRSNTHNIKQKEAPKLEELQLAVTRFKQRGLAGMETVRQFLNANASESKYAAFYTSDQYESEEDLDALRAQGTDSKLFNGL